MKSHCDETSILRDETQADLPEPVRTHTRKIEHRRSTMPSSRHSRNRPPQRLHELNHITGYFDIVKHKRLLAVLQNKGYRYRHGNGYNCREQTRDQDKRGRIHRQSQIRMNGIPSRHPSLGGTSQLLQCTGTRDIQARERQDPHRTPR